MANYEDTSPRNDIIIFVAALSVVGLLGYAWGVSSYFTALAEDEVRGKVLTRGHEVAAQAEAEAEKALHSGPVTIEEAMRKLAAEGRDADPLIEPKASNQVDPLYGWSFHPDYEERKAALQAEGIVAEEGGSAEQGEPAATEKEAAESEPGQAKQDDTKQQTGTKSEKASKDTGTQKDVTPEAEQAKGE